MKKTAPSLQEIEGFRMNIQFVRLDNDLCETINRIALENRRTVSDLVNDMLRGSLEREGTLPPAKAASGDESGAAGV